MEFVSANLVKKASFTFKTTFESKTIISFSFKKSEGESTSLDLVKDDCKDNTG